MKKNLLIFLILCVICVLTLTACGDSNGNINNDNGNNNSNNGDLIHTHTYSNEWSYDDAYHYKKSTCEHINEINEKQSHIMNGNKCSVCDYLTESQGLEYELINDGQSFSVVDIGTCNDVDIIIPASYENKPVTCIGFRAFYNSSTIKSIIIPDSVSVIASSAICNCNLITSIQLSNNILYIGSNVFLGCNALTIYCEATSKPSGWSDNWNFASCPVVWDSNNNELAEDGSIYKIIDGIRYSLKDGKATVVGQMGNITIANIPTMVTYKEVSYSVTTIGDWAFRDCDLLSSVTIPNSVTEIKNKVFWYCSELKSVTISNKLNSIGELAFRGCTKLERVVIPNTVLNIGDHAFIECTALTIYCEATTKPNGWSSSWNSSNSPVEWGYTQK